MIYVCVCVHVRVYQSCCMLTSIHKESRNNRNWLLCYMHQINSYWILEDMYIINIIMIAGCQ